MILLFYKTIVRVYNFYMDVREASWEMRDFKISRVCNFYVDVRQASWEIRDFKILRVCNF